MVVSGGGLTLPGDCRFCKQSNRRFFDCVLNEEKEKEIIVYMYSTGRSCRSQI